MQAYVELFIALALSVPHGELGVHELTAHRHFEGSCRAVGGRLRSLDGDLVTKLVHQEGRECGGKSEGRTGES